MLCDTEHFSVYIPSITLWLSYIKLNYFLLYFNIDGSIQTYTYRLFYIILCLFSSLYFFSFFFFYLIYLKKFITSLYQFHFIVLSLNLFTQSYSYFLPLIYSYVKYSYCNDRINCIQHRSSYS